MNQTIKELAKERLDLTCILVMLLKKTGNIDEGREKDCEQNVDELGINSLEMTMR